MLRLGFRNSPDPPIGVIVVSQERFVYSVYFFCYNCKREETKRLSYKAFEGRLKERRVGCSVCGNKMDKEGPMMFFYRDIGEVDDDNNNNCHVVVKRVM